MSLETFTTQYIATALWSSTDNSNDQGGEPLDANYAADDIAPEALAKMQADCEKFYTANEAMFVERDDERAGHDFWLTRNGHGAGFWDGDYPEYGDLLTEKSKEFGECDIYVGDDGQLYVN